MKTNRINPLLKQKETSAQNSCSGQTFEERSVLSDSNTITRAGGLLNTILKHFVVLPFDPQILHLLCCYQNCYRYQFIVNSLSIKICDHF